MTTVVVGGKEIQLAVPKADMTLANRASGKYQKPSKASASLRLVVGAERDNSNGAERRGYSHGTKDNYTNVSAFGSLDNAFPFAGVEVVLLAHLWLTGHSFRLQTTQQLPPHVSTMKLLRDGYPESETISLTLPVPTYDDNFGVYIYSWSESGIWGSSSTGETWLISFE